MLRQRLSEVEKKKIDSANFAICTATTEKARKQALENKSMMISYGTSCYLQILDEEPAPQPSRKEELRKKRLARADEKKQMFLQQLALQQASIQQDHDYGLISCDTVPAKQCAKSEIVIQKRAKELYSHHVCLSPSSISEIEESTRGQHESERWYHERRLRITSSVMKEICHQRPSTSCTTFIKKSYHQHPSMYQQFLMAERMKRKQFSAMQIITEAKESLCKSNHAGFMLIN